MTSSIMSILLILGGGGGGTTPTKEAGAAITNNNKLLNECSRLRVKLQEWALGRESAPWTWRGDFVTKQAVREKGTWTGGRGKKPNEVTNVSPTNRSPKKREGNGLGFRRRGEIFFQGWNSPPCAARALATPGHLGKGQSLKRHRLRRRLQHLRTIAATDH